MTDSENTEYKPSSLDKERLCVTIVKEAALPIKPNNQRERDRSGLECHNIHLIGTVPGR